jgi:methionine-rich copper-binding protein CopC/nitrogen fixation protein FixH
LQKSIFIKDSVVVVVSFFIICSIIISLYPGTAYGHATPVSYSPPANAVISMQQQGKSLPDKIVILFSERPEPKVSYIHVTDSENKRVDNNDFKITGQNNREATVTLDKSKLSDGVYSVSWLVLSRDDGHITKGSYVFNIQPPQLQQPQQKIISAGQQTNAFSESSIVDNENLTLKITPFYVGQNTFNVTLTNELDTSPTNIRNVILSFNNREAGVGPIIANLNKTGEGEFSAQGSYLSQSGNWEIGVTAQRSRAYDFNHDFEVTVQASAANNTSSS